MEQKRTYTFTIDIPGVYVVDADLMPDGSCMLKFKGCEVAYIEAMLDGTCIIKFHVANAENATPCDWKKIFRRVEVSKLRPDDEFLLTHQPTTREEKKFREEVMKVIEKVSKGELQDFYRPVLDPSFTYDKQICYQAGSLPAMGKSYEWWIAQAKNFCPERRSRLGTYYEYIAFLAWFIKKAPEYGKTYEWAWDVVCNDSTDVGHYAYDCEEPEDVNLTGSDEVHGFCDLANAPKLLTAGEEGDTGFWKAGGGSGDEGDYSPLANMEHFNRSDYNSEYCTGWIVCPC